MNNIMLRIKTMYNDMGPGEKKVANWILENQSKIISMSITELADKCGCGEATIVRFARRLGLIGYQELKISIAQETSSSGHIVNESITRDDSCSVVFSKISNDIYRSLEHTKKVLNVDNIDVVEALKLSKESGATTICITNFGKSPIIKQSDITLFTASEETKYTILAMNSRIAQLAIIDSIYIYIVFHKSEEAIKAIHDTERSLQSKKY